MREGRHRAAPIDSEAWFLACCRYIEANPVRVGRVARPRDDPRSSWPAHALGRGDPLIRDHPLHSALGESGAARQSADRALFRPAPDADVLDAICRATNGGWALDDRRFSQAIAAALGRHAALLPKGRPAKARVQAR